MTHGRRSGCDWQRWRDSAAKMSDRQEGLEGQLGSMEPATFPQCWELMVLEPQEYCRAPDAAAFASQHLAAAAAAATAGAIAADAMNADVAVKSDPAAAVRWAEELGAVQEAR